jgi:hypothetical protein
MSMPSPEQQQRARIFGVLFALTFVTSIAALILYDPVLNDADYILGDGADGRVTLGALCEILLAITNIGTAVVLWPIVRRQSETLALSYVASRVMESTVIVVGLISVMSVVSLREDLAGSGADAGSLTVAGESLVAIHDLTFLLGPGFCVGVNGLVLGWLFYRSRPRAASDCAVWRHRRPPDLRLGDRRAVRRLRARRGALPLLDPGDRLRVLDHRLHDLEGLQAVADPRQRPLRRGLRD